MSNNFCIFYVVILIINVATKEVVKNKTKKINMKIIKINTTTVSNEPMDYYEDESNKTFVEELTENVTMTTKPRKIQDPPPRWKVLDEMYNISAYKKYPAPEEYPDTSIARQLEEAVKVLCWVWLEQEWIAPFILASWGQRCTVFLFMSSTKYQRVPTIVLPIKDAKQYHWGFTKAAFRYVFEHHRWEADWFLRADDDTYIILENLRYMLKDYNTKEPIYFGCRYKPYVQQGFMTSGAGYVLSREALTKFVREGLPSPLCKQDDEGPSDIVMGLCMQNIGVKAIDSRDPMARGRFFPFLPRDHMFPFKDKRFWYWNHIYDPVEEGFNCCSDFAVSFHYVPPGVMIEFDYLIYKLKPYGIKYNYPPLNLPKKDLFL